jgi:hypothetical protein
MGSAFAAILLCALSLCAPALADSTSSTQTTAPSTGVAVALAIVYLSRRAKIGGWLLYYYVQLYASVLISLFFVPTVIANLSPGKWDTSAAYVWYVLTVVPQEIGVLAEVVLATALLRLRSEALLQRLRQVLLVLVVIYAAAVCIDYPQSTDPSNAILDGVRLINAMIWCAYFYRSTRVERVFVYQNWVYVEQPSAKPTPQERRYRLKRAAVSGTIAFVIAMLLFGVAQEGDKKPDPVFLFAVPAFYAFVAFAIAWAVPIGRKKRLELAGVCSPMTLP